MTNKMTNQEILIYILKRTELRIFNRAIKKHNLRLIYDVHQKHLLNHLFDGKMLKYSVTMSNVFNEIQTNENEFKSLDLEQKIEQLKFSIKYDRKNFDLIKEHNNLVSQFMETNKPIKELSKLFRKIYKSQLVNASKMMEAGQ